jgi:glycine hydroxymethyltransferase
MTLYYRVADSAEGRKKMSYLENYMQKSGEKKSKAAIAYMASLDCVRESNPFIAEKIVQELRDQRSRLKLIASENYCSLAVQLAMGNLLTDKYCEGVPFHRFYAGCDNVDAIEQSAVESAKAVFGCDHAYVQPHSGIDANLVAFWAILVQRVQNKKIEELGKKTLDELTPQEYEEIRKLLVGQKMMGLALSSGGHLTHGYRHNVSAKMMHSVPYEVDRVTGLIDYQDLQQKVIREKPLIVVAGYSSYPRLINFATMKEIAASVGAALVVDMAHFAGLVAGKVMQGDYNPIPFADIVTSTTHKTLRGPRGGIVLCTKEFQEVVDKGCPLVLGGPLPHVIAAKAIAFKEASTVQFQEYARQIVNNARALGEAFIRKGAKITTDGTDNHLLVVDVMASFGLTGRQAENALYEANITLNRNAVPFDAQGPWYTSGIRIGTPAITTLGMKEAEMEEIADMICKLLKASCSSLGKNPGEKSRAKVDVDAKIMEEVRQRGAKLLSCFPLYPELLID